MSYEIGHKISFHEKPEKPYIPHLRNVGDYIRFIKISFEDSVTTLNVRSAQ